MCIQVLEHGATKSSFAGTHFAGELHEAFPFADTIEQVIESLAVFAAIKEKTWVRRNVERRLA